MKTFKTGDKVILNGFRLGDDGEFYYGTVSELEDWDENNVILTVRETCTKTEYYISDGEVRYSVHPSEINLLSGNEEETSEVEVGTQTETNNTVDHLVDQLEGALANLEAAEEEVERLQRAYREAYPLINGIVLLQEDMDDPENWKEGDVVISEEGAEDIPVGNSYTLIDDCEQGCFGTLIYFKDDAGVVRMRVANNYRFSHRPQ